MQPDISGRRFLVDLMRVVYAPRTNLPAWKWGEENIVLDSAESINFQGPYDSGLTPYTRFMQEFVTGQFGENVEFHPDTPADTVWKEFFQMKSSQVGFTLATLVILAFWIAEIRKNALYAIDSKDEARKISKSRLQPMLRNCRATAAKIEESEDEQSNLTLFLMGMTLYLIGAYSAGAFANKSGALGICDEAEKYPECPQGEADGIDAMRSRLKVVEDSKLIVLSTPKTDQHKMARECRTGTLHKCFVPCPHCDHFQELIWERMRFGHCKDFADEWMLERVLRETFYECELCHQPIHEHHRRAMIDRHRWRQTNPKPTPGKISAHISDLYSPFVRWGQLAMEWIEAQQDLNKLIDFFNNRLGLPRQLQKSVRQAGDIERLRGAYPRGSIPITPVLVTVNSDVQDDVKKWVKLGFNLRGDCWVIDWGHTLTFEELLDVARDPVPIGVPQGWEPKHGWDGPTCVHRTGIVDDGHLGKMVRAFCLRNEGVFYPAKGRGIGQIRQTVQETQLFTEGGEAVFGYLFSDDDFKRDLYVQRIGKHQQIVDGKVDLPRLWLPWNIEPEFVDELTSEQLDPQKDRYGFTREKWKKNPSIPNDFPDAIKLGLVTWYVMRPVIETEQEEAAAEAEAAPATVGGAAAL